MHKTALHDKHKQAGAKMVDFAGWEMPLHYGSQLQEHHSVRKAVGLFDVSHMAVVDVPIQSGVPLRRVFANDINKLDTAGKALYTAMLNEAGGVIDDVLVYRMQECYRIVLNCARADRDTQWLQQQIGEPSVELRRDLCILALQGPDALDLLGRVSPALFECIATAAPFRCAQHNGALIGATGYTGERGVELILPSDAAVLLWSELIAAGAVPAGLAARDTLRLEAGLNLYGNDMDETIHPLRANLGWTINLSKHSDFIGAQAVCNAEVEDRLVGLVFTGRGILRDEQNLYADDALCGTITSGGYSPTLESSIALARLNHKIQDTCSVEIRGRREQVSVVKPRFVRNGKSVVEKENRT